MELQKASNKKTLVMGASPNPSRYSNMATQKLRRYGHEVVLYGSRRGDIDGLPIANTLENLDTEGIHTVTMYLGEQNQAPYEDFLVELKPKRVLFNPGAENPRLEKKLDAAGVKVIHGCTLVMLGAGSY